MSWVKNKQLWGVLTGILLMAFCLGDLSLADISHLSQRLNYYYLIPSLFCSTMFLIMRGLRWRIMINQQSPIAPVPSILLYSAGQVLNIVMPVLTGQVGRLILFSRKQKLGKTFIFSTIVLEIVFDATSLIIFVMFISLAFAFPPQYRTISYIIAGATVFALACLYLVLHYRINLENFGRRHLKDISPGAYITIKKFLRSFTKGIEMLKSSQHMAGSILLSLASWVFHVLALYFLFYSFGFDEPIAIAAALMVINTLILMIPITPGNAGTFEMAVSRFLVLFAASGISLSDAVLYALALHLIDLIPIFGLGLTYLHYERLTLRQLKLAQKEEVILDKISEEGSYVDGGHQ